MLTKSELVFIKAQGVNVDQVFDGRGIPATLRKSAAKTAGAILVLGTPCKKHGHRLRTRSGHCVQCDTSKIAHQNRFRDSGYVYIAGSMNANVLKIGTAKDISQRERNLNGHVYGGYDDWKMLFYAKVEHGGKTEQAALAKLAKWRVPKEYEKDGKFQLAEEMVLVPFGVALKTVVDTIGSSKHEDSWMAKNWQDYDFKK